MLTCQLGHKPPDRNGQEREPGARSECDLVEGEAWVRLLQNVLRLPATQGGPGNRDKPM